MEQQENKTGNEGRGTSDLMRGLGGGNNVERIDWKFEGGSRLLFKNEEFEIRLSGDEKEAFLAWHWKVDGNDYYEVFKDATLIEVEAFIINNLLACKNKKTPPNDVAHNGRE